MARNCNCRKCRKAHRKAERREHREEEHHCAKECATDCDKALEVDVDVEPTVHCEEKKRHGSTAFEVELDFKTKPSCSVRKIEKKCVDSPCAHKCVFVVDVDVDFECKHRISKHPGRPHAEYEVDVHVDTKSKLHEKC